MVPVVNRHDHTARRRDFHRGNPTRRPVRFPVLESDQFFNATTRFARPDEYASFEFSAHHGATSPLAMFHARRNAGSDHDTDGVNSSPARPYDRSASRWDRFAFTRAKPQLNATRAAPQCDDRARTCDGVGSNANRYARTTSRHSTPPAQPANRLRTAITRTTLGDTPDKNRHHQPAEQHED